MPASVSISIDSTPMRRHDRSVVPDVSNLAHQRRSNDTSDLRYVPASLTHHQDNIAMSNVTLNRLSRRLRCDLAELLPRIAARLVSERPAT
jgi:hypothetical protein